MTKAWDDYREEIIGEYKENNKPLHEVQRIMEERHRFKASTRAYRSRLDKWGIYKYSCRKRKGSISTMGRGSPEADDSGASSPPHTPDLDENCGGPRGDSDSPISPMSTPEHQFFGSGMYGTSPPSGSAMKIEPPPYYHHNNPQMSSPNRPPMSPSNTGYYPDSQYQYFSPQQRHFHRPNTQEHVYHQLHGPGSMNMGGIASSSVPTSPTQGGYLHHPHHVYSPWSGIDNIKSQPE